MRCELSGSQGGCVGSSMSSLMSEVIMGSCDRSCSFSFMLRKPSVFLPCGYVSMLLVKDVEVRIGVLVVRNTHIARCFSY